MKQEGYILYRGSRDELNEMCRVKDERIAELEDAIRSLVAWGNAIELAAPELGGCLAAMYSARALLEKNKEDKK